MLKRGFDLKKYIVFAGVNGAGKTTFYQTYPEMMNMPRVNVDEIVRGLGDWKNPKDVAEAGRIAVRAIKQYFDEGRSFIRKRLYAERVF